MKAIHCPRCGTKLVDHTFEGRVLGKCPRLEPKECAFVDYDPPLSVGVALIEKDNGIVLVQRKIHPIGKWCMPAGFLNTNEAPDEGTVREVSEESGLLVVIPEVPFAIRKVPNANQNLMFFLASSHSGEMKPGSDASDVQVFSPDALPDMAFPLHTQVIGEHFARKAKEK